MVTNHSRPVLVSLRFSFSSYHCDLKFLEFCTLKKIIVFGGIPHASHKWQTADTHWIVAVKRFLKALKEKHYLERPYTTISKGQYCKMLLDATNACLTPDAVRAAFRDNGQMPPTFDLVSKLGDKVSGRNVAELALDGNVQSRPLRRRSGSGSQTASPSPLPARPTASYLLDPLTSLPHRPPPDWSFQDFYDAVKDVLILHQGGLANREIARQQALATKGPRFAGPKAQVLTAPEALEHKRAEIEQKKKIGG